MPPVLSRAFRATLIALPFVAFPALAYAAGGFDGANGFFEGLYSTITDNDKEVITTAAVIGLAIALFTQSWKPFVVALIGGALLASVDSLVDWFMGLFA